MAHKKGVGSSRNGRDSNPKMLGVKRYDGHVVKNGEVLVRQRGTRIMAGRNVGVGRDHTLFALIAGSVKFQHVGRYKKAVNINPIPVALVVDDVNDEITEVAAG